MRIVYAGTPEVAVPSLRALVDGDHEVVGVLSRPDTVSGRGRKVTRAPVALLADEHHIPVITPRRLSDPDVADTLRSWAPDVGVVVAYGGLIPQALLDLPTHGWVNLHFSVLPAWRGAAPVQAAIAAGDETTGASTFRLEAGLDTGPVYGSMTERIRPADTGGDILDRLSRTGAGLLTATLDGIADGSLVPVPQPDDGVSHAPKIEVDDARVRWDLPAHIIDRRIRAHTPTPGAWTTLADDRIKLGPVTVATPDEILHTASDEGKTDTPPGTLLVTRRDVYVITGSAPVRLGEVQAPGKRAMPARDWARGAHLDEGAMLR